MAEPHEPTHGDLEGDESLDYLEEMDDVARERREVDSLARQTRRTIWHEGDALGSIHSKRVVDALDRTARQVYGRLPSRELQRLVKICNAETGGLSPEIMLALGRLLAEPKSHAMRDDEVVELARQLATRGEERRDRTVGASLIEIAEATIVYGQQPDVPIWIPTSDRGAKQIVRLMLGALVALIGGTGSGKTSLALEIAVCHAQWNGPVAFFGLELRAVETAARLVGQREMTGWLDAARLPAQTIRAALSIPRMYVWGRISIAEMRECIRDVKAKHPGEPVLIVVDYLQILVDVTERMAFASAIEGLRNLLQEEECLGIATSQTSRAGAVALRTSAKLGKETEDTGAESAQLERASYVTLALGEQGEDNGHGWRPIDLSIGKERMGAGDSVMRLLYHGRSGRFAVDGEAERAAEVRTRRAAKLELDAVKKHEERNETLVIEYLRGQTEPVSRTRIETECGGRKQFIAPAVRRLIGLGVVVEVGEGRRPGYLPPVMLATLAQTWTPQPPSQPPLLDTPHTPRGGAASTQSTETPPQGSYGPGGVVGGLMVEVIESGGVEKGGSAEPEEWKPNPAHRSYAAQYGLDLQAAVLAVEGGPRTTDPDGALMAALVRARAAALASPQGGFLGFGPKKKP